MPNWSRSGLILMTFAVLLFSVVALLAKYAAASVPAPEVVFFRSSINAVILLVFHLASGRSARSMLGNNRRLLVLRGVMGAGAMNLFFFGLAGLPVADVTLLFMISPVFVLPLAAWLLKEPVRTRQLVFVPPVLAGVFLVLQPDLRVLNVPGLCAIGSAIIAAGSHVIIRKLRKEDSHVVVLYFSVCATLASIPLMLPGFRWPQGATLAALIGAGVVSVPAQWLMTRAYRFETAGRVAMVNYLGVLFALFWDLIIFSHVPGWITILGAVLIIASLIGLQGAKREYVRNY